MPERRSLRARTSLTSGPSAPAAAPVSTRPRRAASGAAASGSIVKVTRDESNSPDDSKKALRLTVKIPSSKLREATSNTRPTSRGNAAAQLRDSLTTGEIVSGPRVSRANKKYVVESESDEEDDEEDEDVDASVDDVEDEDDEEEQEEEEQIGGPEESSDEEADEEDEDADVDADGDVEMDDDADDGQLLPSQQPVLKVKGPTAKPTVTVTPAQDAKIKSVEAKEMEMDDDDEELSDLSEDDEEQGEGGEEDAEGEDVDEMDQDDDSRSPGSRASTPDVSKMTKRQRSRLDQVMGGDFLQLPMEPQTKKHLTVEEHAMRRAEMARRRKNLSEKRNEEEKMDTINRLLKKQAPKRRGKISAAEINAQEHGDESPQEMQEEEIPPANPVYVRWISDKEGCRIGVPGEWFGQPVGSIFEERKMVEEVEG
ncbi:hypothetical protein OEA41_006397 [Lepraria neglecta]|uniref:INO80 complex subunit B-like conserved region domain-containing protein n=1 Tax=Lepraria neglecta TaxID=209136 RepID=A0AAE0DN06_9LECA|nr:hypothetical protein OEA41_006397 [Lepraria neglecta]